MSGSLERRHSKRLQTRQGSAPYVKPDKSGDNSTGLTKYMGDSSLDWDGDAQRRCRRPRPPAAQHYPHAPRSRRHPVLMPSRTRRSESFVKRGLKSFGRGKAKTPPLPKNWKMVKEKDGAFGKEKVYYLNTVTNQRSHEPPPPLPKGWKEALHKDSGRVYYYNKQTRETTFEFPGNGAAGEDMDDDDDDDDEVPAGELRTRYWPSHAALARPPTARTERPSDIASRAR